MTASITRLTLFVPGNVDKAWSKALRKVDVESESIDNDGTFGQAFSFGTVEPALVAKIDKAPGAMVLHWPIDLREGRAQIVEVVQRLIDVGALAVRIEQSKVGWSASQWLELFSAENPVAWHRGAVAFLEEDGFLQSCGMHAFSLPDVRLPVERNRNAMQQLGSLLNVYQLAEDPVIRSGETFSPDRDTPKRVIERWPDVQYPPSHSCNNPYGVWKVGPSGGKSRSLGELVPTFIPTLRALLGALEDKLGEPLTKAQVEKARDSGVCMAMEPRDVQQLERSRGYADLDPELAWEQWKLVRATAT